MNIFLANMPVIFNARQNLEPPLGIAYLAAALEAKGERVYLKDFEVEHFSADGIASFIEDNDIDIAGASFRTASYGCAKEFYRAAKKARRRVILIAGGHHASAFPEHTLRDTGCDIVVRGEAEHTIVQLSKAIREGRDLSALAGICFNDNGNVLVTPKAEPLADLDALSLPSRHLLPMESYNAVTVLTSRGCPFSCIYCDKGVSTRQVKYRSPEDIFAEIRQIKKQYPQKRVYFVDDHFFLRKERLANILSLMEKDRPPLKWVCQARADGIDADMLQMAKRAGCELIIFGIESADAEELEYMKKGCSVEQARRAILLTHQAGIRVRANFMLGFPVSTRQSIGNTVRFARSVPLDVVRFFSVTPLPNTELWDRVYGKGAVLEKVDWEKFDFYTPTYAVGGLGKKDILGYLVAAYIFVLKRRVLLELTVRLLPNFLKLARLFQRSGKVRGCVSIAFPASVNFILDLKMIAKAIPLSGKLKLFREALALQKEING